jgi:hypothetical protein
MRKEGLCLQVTAAFGARTALVQRTSPSGAPDATTQYGQQGALHCALRLIAYLCRS